MGDRTPRNEPFSSEPEDAYAGRIVDLPDAQTEPLRTGRKRISSPTEDGDGPGFQRVVRRHRLRAEVLLVIAASLFLAASLVKPWASSLPAHTLSAAPTGTPTQVPTATSAHLAAAVATPAATAWQSPVGWPDVPQWDYGWPVPDASPSAQPGSSGAAADPRWSAVDWTVLSTTDPHDSWGYGTAVMPDLAQLPASVATPAPVTTWVAAGAPRYTTISVVRGSQVFGLAVTWPHSIHVTSMTVGYIGGPEHPANMPPAGFPAFAEVSAGRVELRGGRCRPGDGNEPAGNRRRRDNLAGAVLDPTFGVIWRRLGFDLGCVALAAMAVARRHLQHHDHLYGRYDQLPPDAPDQLGSPPTKLPAGAANERPTAMIGSILVRS
jgi:hypothetical protein